MNKSAIFLLLGTAFLLGAQSAMATNTVNITNKVNVQQNTSTSTQGTSHIKVTVNGKTIETDKNEDINYESEDGTTKVHISNSNSNSTITPPVKPTLSPETKEKIQEMKKEHEKKKAELKKKLEEQKEEVKKKIEDKKFDLREFFENEFPFLKILLSALPQA